jgi:hypothetical protein
LYVSWPGTDVSVVNSYAAASECVPVRRLMRVLLPTDGKPMKPTDATPVRATSNPAPPPPPLELGVSSSRLSLASLALSCPRWYDVALFFCVRAICEGEGC